MFQFKGSLSLSLYILEILDDQGRLSAWLDRQTMLIYRSSPNFRLKSKFKSRSRVDHLQPTWTM